MQNNLSLKIECLDIYNLALYNNSIPLIDELLIINDTDYNQKNIEVEISSSPSFFSPFITKIGNISSGRHIIINPHDLDIDLTKVMYSTAPITSLISVKIKSLGEVISETTKSVVLYPYDYIPSLDAYTELISAFVTPEQEEIKAITKIVFEHVKNDYSLPVNQDMWDYNNELLTSGIIKSIYSAICDLKITINASTSNENKPAKIKLPESVIATKNGTSTEIALLTASVAESLGINSFITFVGDKALVGFFYYQESFKTCISDDSISFRNITNGKNDKFVLIDTTSIMYGTNVTFENSSLTAQKILDRYDNPVVIDIATCRKNGYKSLPVRIKQDGNIIFEVKNKDNVKNNATSFDFIKSSELLSNYVRQKIQATNLHSKCYSLINNDTIFLIGTTRQIISKYLFNNSLNLKFFPLSNQTNENFDFFEKIVQLNNNIDKNDFSSTINIFADKKEGLFKAQQIVENRDNKTQNICTGLGIIKYIYGDKISVLPIFYCETDIKIDFNGNITLTPFATDLKLNPFIKEFLSIFSLHYDFSKYRYNYLEHYDLIIQDFKKICSGVEGFEIYDIALLSSLSIDSMSLSSRATSDFFERSNLLKSIFENGKIERCKSYDEYNWIQEKIPVPLDSSEETAYKSSQKNLCTVFSGPNGSGKTTTCASAALSAVMAGERVLYLSSSKTNLNTFDAFAQKYKLNDYIFKITDNKFYNSFSKSSKASTTNIINDTSLKLSSAIEKESAYYKNLHSVKEVGFSLFESISQYERYRTFPYSVTFTYEQIGKLTKDGVVLWFDTVSQLAKAGAECKEPHSNPLFYIKESNFSYDLKSKSAILLSRHLTVTKNFIDAQNALSEFLGIEIPIMKESQTQTLLDLSQCVLDNADYIYNGIFLKKDIDSAFSRIEVVLSQSENYFSLRDFLKENFKSDVVLLDCDGLLTEWRNANSKFALSKQSALTQLKNKLKAYLKNPKIVTNDNFTDLVSKVSSYITSKRLLQENAKLILEITGVDISSMLESNDSGNFDEIKSYISSSRKYLKTLIDIYDSEQQPSTIFTHNYNLFRNPTKLKEDTAPLFKEFNSAYNSYIESEKEVVSLLNIDIGSAKEHNNKIWYYFVVQFFDKMLSSIDLLKYWCAWNVEKDKAISIGLENVVKLYESEQLSAGDIKNAFLKGFFKSVSEYFLSLDDIINSFSSENHKQELSEIKKLLNINAENVVSELKTSADDNITKFLEKNKISENEAYETLNNTLSYNLNHTLNKDNMNLLQQVKPCIVCDSAKSILKLSTLPEFDLLIIDNDIKQSVYELLLLLPLSKRIIYTETQETFFGNLLRQIGAENVNFNWMYNANRTMSVVNELFFSNTLSVVPPMNQTNSKINVIYQLGNYDRKKTRVNVIEASAVVDEIIKYTSDYPENSVGVYTMTREQKHLVELLLQKRSGTEYIKNVTISTFTEAVYDPKDYVIFSTVFSNEERSKYNETITRTIPELASADTCHRILNILSSATGEFSIVTSLSHDILDNFKTTEKNYYLFKKLLKKFFNSSKSRIQKINSCDTVENSIIRQVASFIESIGYKADLKVGLNKAIIDIAVKNKGSENYLLGIMFDESAYINSDNFFGRNLIFNNLKHVGEWKLISIHTVEWFENPNKQLDMISSALNQDKSEIDFPIYN